MNTPLKSTRNLTVALGTALWGWGINKTDAFEILDQFVARGYELVDTATNYPINSKKEDFGLALNWIEEWLRLKGSKKLKVYVKLGSLDNLGNSNNDLSMSYLKYQFSILERRFENSLYGAGIHWDNRGNKEHEVLQIEETLEFFRSVFQRGLKIGFSGVTNLELYSSFAPDLAKDWLIQIKENIFESSQQVRNSVYFPKAEFFAYGINSGGLKLEEPRNESSLFLRGDLSLQEEKRNTLLTLLQKDAKSTLPAKNFNQLSIKHIWNQKIFHGLVIGPRNTTQLNDSLDYISMLESISS